MTTGPAPDPYVCATCGARYVVPSLARDCEQTHDGPLTAAGAAALVAKRIY